MKLLVLAAMMTLTSSAFAAEHKVMMKNMTKEGAMAFEPGFIKAAVGDTVTFVPTDVSHQAQSVVVPAGAKPFKGALDKPVSVKLSSEGVYVVECFPHATMNMTGIIQVGAPKNLADAQKAVNDLESKSVMNKGRLKGYLAKVK